MFEPQPGQGLPFALIQVKFSELSASFSIQAKTYSQFAGLCSSFPQAKQKYFPHLH